MQVVQAEGGYYQILLGIIASLVGFGIAVFSWWAKSIMTKMCQIEMVASEGNKVVTSMLREISEIKVAQNFTSIALRDLRSDFTAFQRDSAAVCSAGRSEK